MGLNLYGLGALGQGFSGEQRRLGTARRKRLADFAKVAAQITAEKDKREETDRRDHETAQFHADSLAERDALTRVAEGGRNARYKAGVRQKLGGLVSAGGMHPQAAAALDQVLFPEDYPGAPAAPQIAAPTPQIAAPDDQPDDPNAPAPNPALAPPVNPLSGQPAAGPLVPTIPAPAGPAPGPFAQMGVGPRAQKQLDDIQSRIDYREGPQTENIDSRTQHADAQTAEVGPNARSTRLRNERTGRAAIMAAANGTTRTQIAGHAESEHARHDKAAEHLSAAAQAERARHDKVAEQQGSRRLTLAEFRAKHPGMKDPNQQQIAYHEGEVKRLTGVVQRADAEKNKARGNKNLDAKEKAKITAAQDDNIRQAQADLAANQAQVRHFQHLMNGSMNGSMAGSGGPHHSNFQHRHRDNGRFRMPTKRDLAHMSMADLKALHERLKGKK